jgi:hypothetical protein
MFADSTVTEDCSDAATLAIRKGTWIFGCAAGGDIAA